MKKLAICLIMLASNVINAQHCPYDSSSIIVVQIHNREDQNTIPNLKVTLVKKIKDKIVTSNVCTLTQNNSFPFLYDEYSIIVGSNFDTQNWYLKIESECENGDYGWTYYGTTEVKLTPSDMFFLCGNYDNSDFYDTNDGRVYSPIEVILTKRSCETIEN